MLLEGRRGAEALARLALETAADPGEAPQPAQVKSPLPLRRKVCYAIGSAPFQLTGNALGFFFQLFLLDVVQLEPFVASMILFLGRAWDAVLDPAVGFLVGRSPPMKCGKLVPWIAASTPIAVFFYHLLWFVPSDSLSVPLKFLWYLVMYCGFQTAMSVIACLCVPFWQWFLVRFGKRTAAFVGLSLIMPALVVITQVTHNFLVFVFMVALAGCSLSVYFLLPWSMLPDAVDDFKLRNPTCLNLETFFYSFYVFSNKFAGGLSLGISTMSLHFAGYKAEDCTHNPQVILALRILMAPVPIALLLCSMALLYAYPINEERRKQMQAEMEAAWHRGQTESPESNAT